MTRAGGRGSRKRRLWERWGLLLLVCAGLAVYIFYALWIQQVFNTTFPEIFQPLTPSPAR